MTRSTACRSQRKPYTGVRAARTRQAQRIPSDPEMVNRAGDQHLPIGVAAVLDAYSFEIRA